ncbi:MAG: CidA/LrgA family protein [Alphaproteobacteria bacterium]|nr:CidA/LrgA family protein [Alphaproteobacteria bacterium]
MIKTLAGIGFLVLLLYAVDGIKQALGLPVPSAIVAMLLLTFFFASQRRVPDFVDQGAKALMRVIPLLFIPPLVAILDVRAMVLSHPVVLFLAVTGSTLVGLVVTGLLYKALVRKRGRV